MIGLLRGVVADKRPPYLLLDVGGVGYELEAPMSTFFALPAAGETATLHTHLAVREDALLLFGFATRAEKDLFRDLIKVSGVGAKMALTILSGTGVDEFVTTVQEGDADKLTGLPGVGKKTAARLIVEMRDRIGAAPPAAGGAAPSAGGGPADAVGEAHRALTALGYKPAEATRLLKDLDEPDGDSESLIRQALRKAVR
ncbi:Holliday junction DNA helicase RuvA [Salinisphaera sp. PC39]|uniref:Holliday junction branch migration protein RuvA n=1 Tax=Salinisphaera sp. PC39 TaxID=1304156 RepID=UPI003341C014